MGGILVHVLTLSAVELGFSLNSVKLKILIWVFSPFPLSRIMRQIGATCLPADCMLFQSAATTKLQLHVLV